LKALNVPTLILDREDEVGDNWRRRYKQLVLHDPVWFDHLRT
jgi:cation diffusion facilitator CzcD-associated flavoprotein CzcO